MAKFSFKPVNTFPVWLIVVTIIGGALLGGLTMFIHFKCTEEKEHASLADTEKMVEKFLQRNKKKKTLADSLIMKVNKKADQMEAKSLNTLHAIV